ncbi:GatB/YqeY domain-containing protein [Phototrophicus methaneseepsis]|uniref:GatB/YqeY domain-containing protein n=1 Tax=Phototrophicus methaneseepsis TaxID=2710758 RepID=A0A7S8EDB2_9CHLR|nr:GatB/YqeY domain-containing protein [Phototrophicus methaneseepsis]QPC84875.1 GatB/YqeY domain-containing protein [Phototrophicus methaneseepsis]
MAENAKEQLTVALKEAMRNKETERRNVIRLLQSAIKQVEVDEQHELSDEEVTDVLQKEAKKRRESIEELQSAGREEQAAAEAFELEVIMDFLPKQMTREEIEVMAKEAIAETGASSPKEMGKVMGIMSPKTKGRADGKMVSTVVRELLSQ